MLALNILLQPRYVLFDLYGRVVSEHIKVKSTANVGDAEDEDDDGVAGLYQYFPIFVVAVRDFTLDAELNGKHMADDEYLESILSLKKGTIFHHKKTYK